MNIVGIEGIAYSLGTGSLTNKELQSLKPDWPMDQLTERTGVFKRSIADKSETALDLAERAARSVIDLRVGTLLDVDALIFCTQTPDYILPPNSTLLHGRLEMPHCVMAFDISHACSGFTYGLGIARSLVISKVAKRVLLINADTYTRLLHDDDRSTRGIFGDGASATIVSASNPMITVLDDSYGTDGKHYAKFIVPKGGSRNPNANAQKSSLETFSDNPRRSPEHINMDGMGVLSFFNNIVPKAIKNILKKNNLGLDDIDHFVFHQASALALEGLQRSLDVSPDRVVNKMKTTGNLVSASIPVALSKADIDGDFEKGDMIILAGFGVGLSWGITLARWNGAVD